MTKKPLRLALASAMLMGGLSALTSCGDKFSGLTVNFWHTFGKTVADGIQLRANEFAKYIKETEGVSMRIKMTYKGGYDDLKGEVQKSFSVGGNPTIAVAYPDHIADYFAAEEGEAGRYVVDMDPLMHDEQIGFATEDGLYDEYDEDDIIDAFWQESVGYTREGVYSMPFLKSSEVLLYNFDLVKKALDIIDPASSQTDSDVLEYMRNLTWDDFMDFCEQIMQYKSQISAKLQVPCFYDSDGNLFITALMQNDPNGDGHMYAYLDNNGRGKIGFDGYSSTATAEQKANYEWVQNKLTQYKGWYDKKLFTTKGVEGVYSSNFLTTMKSMFAIGSTGGSGYSIPSTNEFRIEACMVPYQNDNPLYVTQGPTLTLLNNKKLVNAGTNDQAVKYGWRFIKYLTNAKINASICTNNSEGYVPVRNSAYSTDEWITFMTSNTEYVKVAKVVVNDIQNRYFSTPTFQGSSELRNQVAGCFADAIQGKKTVKSALDTAIQQSIMKM